MTPITAHTSVWADPLIVTVAPNGAYKQPIDHPAVPITPATLATLEAAVAAVTGPALLIVGEVAALYTSDDAAAGVIEQAQKTIMGMNA